MKLLLLCLSLAAGLSALTPAQMHVETAKRLLRRGRERDARLELQVALQIEAEQPEARALLASLDGEPTAASATAATEAAAGELEARLRAHLESAEWAYRESDLKAAEGHWREALRLDPAAPGAAAGLARLEAEAYQRDPDRPFDAAVAELYTQAMREVRKGRLLEARRKLEEARVLSPLQPQVLAALERVREGAGAQQAERDAADLLNRGNERLRAGDDAAAAAAFRAALEAKPGLREAEAGLDEIRRRNEAALRVRLDRAARARAAEDWESASREWEAVLALDPVNAAAQEGLREAARRRQNRLLEAQRRREADRLYNAGVDAWQAGDLAGAATQFRLCLALLPGDVEAQRALQSVLKRLDERSAKDRRDAALLLEEGRRLEERGALEEALRSYERALAKDPALNAAAEARQKLEKRLKGL
jgi:tetratricopeptide (TPR) repeat protein